MERTGTLCKLAVFGLGLAALLFLLSCDRPVEQRDQEYPSSPEPIPAPSLSQAKPACLELGREALRRIGGRQVDRHCIELKTGEYLHLVVQQQGADVVVEVFDPQRRRLFKIDSPTGSHSDEHVFLVADVPGEHWAKVQLFNPSSPAADYRIQISELRHAKPTDRLHAMAEKAFAEAVELEEQNPGRAISLYLEAARLWKEIHNGPRQADALFRLGRLYRVDGHNQEALRWFKEALPLRSATERPEERAVLLNDLGVTYRDLGEVGAARRALQEALDLYARVDFPHGKATTLLNLGSLDRQLGRLLEALDSFEQAGATLKGRGYSQTEVIILNELGALYTTMGETDMALRKHQEALGLLDRQSDIDLWVGTLNRMGNAHFEAKDLNAAAKAYQGALDLRKQLTNPRGAAVSLAGLGLVAERRGNKARAESLYRDALKVFEEQEDPLSAGITLNNLGWLYVRQSKAAEALGFFNRALERARKVKDLDLEAATLFGMARAARQRGDLEAASRRIRAVLALVEALRQGTFRSDLRISYLASRQDYFAFFIDLLMEQHRRHPSAGHDALALGASEQSRARQLLDALAENREDLLRRVPLKLLEQQKALGETLQKNTRRQEETLAAYYQVEEEIRQASPWYASLSTPQPLALREIQRQVVDSDTILLEFHLGSPHSFLWVVTPSSLDSFVLPDREALESAARETYEQLQGSHQIMNAAAARRAAADLSWKLLGPAAGLLGSKRLVVVASGALQYIPFAALPEPSPEGPDPAAQPLVARHEIINLPSASVLAVLRQETAGRTAPPGFLAVVADPVVSPEDERLKGLPVAPGKRPAAWDLGLPWFERLPYSREEAEAIAGLAAGRPVQTFLGFDANRDLVLSKRLGSFAIVHFSSHGWLDAEHPELSALVLSRFDKNGRPRDGRLRMHEIYGMDLPADLVVLGGCQTALGREIEGEGLVGMTRGFLYAGARRVLVSLWSVEDHATAELMKRFYRALLVDGLRPGAALRQAQLSMLGEESWSAPFHWAGFVLQGDWN